MALGHFEVNLSMASTSMAVAGCPIPIPHASITTLNVCRWRQLILPFLASIT